MQEPSVEPKRAYLLIASWQAGRVTVWERPKDDGVIPQVGKKMQEGPSPINAGSDAMMTQPIGTVAYQGYNEPR